MRPETRARDYAGKIQIGGSGVNRIAFDDDQRIDLSGPHLRCELSNLLDLVDGPALDGIGIGHCVANVAEGVVYDVRQRMYGGRLLLACNDQT